MPAMLRQNKKATKIAWAILGKPMNMNDKNPYKDKNIDRVLAIENLR